MTDTDRALSLLPDGWFEAADVRESVRQRELWELEDKGLLEVRRSTYAGDPRLYRKPINDKQGGE